MDRLLFWLQVIENDTSGCALPYVVVRSAVNCVQGIVSSPNDKQGPFYTVHTMAAFCNAIAEPRNFM